MGQFHISEKKGCAPQKNSAPAAPRPAALRLYIYYILYFRKNFVAAQRLLGIRVLVESYRAEILGIDSEPRELSIGEVSARLSVTTESCEVRKLIFVFGQFKNNWKMGDIFFHRRCRGENKSLHKKSPIFTAHTEEQTWD